MKRAGARLYLLLLGALYLLFHWPVLFGGKVYMNLWIFRHHAPFPAPEPGQINFLNQSSDFVTHYFGYMDFVAQSIRQGILPLWNPYLLCGFAMYADCQATLFSPFNALFLFMDLYPAYNWILLSYFFLAVSLLFVYLRHHLGVSPRAAFFGCAALLFCPFLMKNIDFYLLMAFVWALPLTVLTCEWTKKMPFLSQCVWRAAALFLITLCGHSHVLVYAYFLLATYPFVRAADGSSLLRKAGVLAGTSAVFAALSFFLMAPRVEFLMTSQRVLSQVTGLQFNVPMTGLTALYPLQYLVPRLDDLLGAVLGKERLFVHTAYIGVLPFILNLAAVPLLLSKGTDGRVRYFVWLNLAYYLSMCVMAPGRLGRFLDFGVMRFYQIHLFSTAVVCAVAFDRLFSEESFRKTFKRVAVFFIAAVVVPATVLAATLSFFPERVGALLSAFLRARGLLVTDDAYMSGRFQELFAEACRTLSLSSPFVFVPLTVSVIGYFLMRFERRQKQALFQWAWIALLLFELWTIALMLRPVPVERAAVFPPTRVTDFLRQDKSLFRIMSIQTQPAPGQGPQKYILKPNLGIPYGLADVGGQNSAISSRYGRFAYFVLSGRRQQAIPTYLGILDFDDFNANVASFLNVKYLLVSDGRPLTEKGLKPVLTADGLTVYENTQALPRVFFTRRAGPQTDEESVFQEMRAQPPGPEPAVSLEGADVPDTRSQTFASPSARPAVTLFRPDRVEIELDTSEPGVLVYTDRMEKGWKAFDRGVEVPVREVNGLFKGLLLEPGEHRIRFVYRPEYFIKGLFVSGVMIVGMLCVLLFQRPRRGKPS